MSQQSATSPRAASPPALVRPRVLPPARRSRPGYSRHRPGKLDPHLQIGALHVELGDSVRLQKINQLPQLFQLFLVHHHSSRAIRRSSSLLLFFTETGNCPHNSIHAFVLGVKISPPFAVTSTMSSIR